MTRRTSTLTALAATLALTVTLSGCNAMREQTSGAPRDEDGVAITTAVKEGVLAALPDTADADVSYHLDGFALLMTVTVRWPEEARLGVAHVQATATAVCENIAGYDAVQLNFYREPDGEGDVETLWSAAFPDVAEADGRFVHLYVDDCEPILDR